MTFATASYFCDNRGRPAATLMPMDGRSDVGKRIRDAAEAKKIAGATELCELLHDELRRRGLKQTFTRQTLSNWWNGKVWPDLDTLPALAEVLGSEQEWILFGSRRGDQLKKERQYLTRVSEEEAALLTSYREASKAAQKTILKTAKTISEEHPAPEADVHQMRRKDDRHRN
jgi:transcriptional regulator with XRE-family HTH domain